MNTSKTQRFSALLALLAVVACDDVATDPDFGQITAEQQFELAVLEDEGSFEVAAALVSVATDVGTARGNPGTAEARSLNSDALAAFNDARSAWMAGDHVRALDSSRLARRLVARALIATGGVPAVEDLLERLQDLIMTIDAEVVDDPDALRAELEAIVAEATALLEAGDTVGAAARAILGEQRARLRRGRHHRPFDISERRARLEVDWARSAVALAERLIADDVVPVTDVLTTSDVVATDVVDRRNKWLAHAKRWLSRAETALENGHFARAVHAAHHAQWSALKAVILPGGITEEEIRAMLDLAQTLHEQAVVAVGDDATELELRVLNRAADLIEIGIRKLEAGQKRGVAALWRSSLMSHWLIS